MTTRPAARDLAGLARSLVIYRARPWKNRALARLYGTILRPGDLAFDIGAHVGNRSRAMLAAGARVVALEPQPLLHAFLARDLPPGATLIRAAAGAREGTGQLAIPRLHPTVASLAPGFAAEMGTAPGFAHVRWDAAETVRVTTLDALIAAHGAPRFVKIDVEGFEDAVLAGLSHPVGWIAFETLPALPRVAAASLERISLLGRYEFNFISGETRGFALDAWTDAAGIAALLARAARSGDVYARLIREPA
ncbi:FkbM family methyltransferase [Amaricoccus solimangrovi]|uniref:FkbM family methyltransferase n=1 Tax=Amaricoccus solimangrovi TaxID=2589815 RepID=A0A501WDU3_9RHOB|nr:FkbM family methyltransferase [Amaricoccus solimangrovi]TPE47568.1 FkbM family methyltransferase [Amaricoccus solimangrovi]